MGRRTRKMARKTPLSIVDKMIYIIVEILFCIVLPFAVLLLFVFVFPDKIAFSDETVLLNDNRFGIFASLVPAFSTLIIFLLPISYAYTNRIPLVGNRYFKPKNFENIIPTYSLFSKNFNKNILPGFDKKVRIYTCASLFCLVISLVIAPLGLCPRITIDTSDTVKFYNVFNVCVREYHWSEASDLEIDIVHMRKSHRMGIEIWYKLDGKSIELAGTSNYFKDYEERLRYYNRLKDYFDEGEYTVESEDMDRLLSTNDFSPSEIQLIYELFDYTP